MREMPLEGFPWVGEGQKGSYLSWAHNLFPDVFVFNFINKTALLIDREDQSVGRGRETPKENETISLQILILF